MRAALVLVGLAIVLGGCPPPLCEGEPVFTVDSAACDVDGSDGCTVDFGAVDIGLSASRRVAYTNDCDGAVNLPVIGERAGDAEDDDVFALGDTEFFIGGGVDGFSGFVFVLARPRTGAEERDTLTLTTSFDETEKVVFPLVVNAGR